MVHSLYFKLAVLNHSTANLSKRDLFIRIKVWKKKI